MKDMFVQVGQTTDGKAVCKGIFKFYETNGIPLDVLFDLLDKQDIMISWCDFYIEAISAGMEHNRIISKLEEPICDVWGKKFFDVVKENLERFINSNKMTMKAPPIKLSNVAITQPMTTIEITQPMEQFKTEVISGNNDWIYLYRPVGGAEQHLIRLSGFKKFPPRLAHQPIFYPVASEEYAIKIARDWNAKDGNNGYVLRFKIRKSFIGMYNLQTVGGISHQEYWIPAEHIDQFNCNIVGDIEIIHVFTEKTKT
jgi:hypothetical protein